MNAELSPIARIPAPPALPQVAPSDLYAALLADARAANTRTSRIQDINALASFLGMEPAAACVALVASGAGQAAAIATAFSAGMRRDLKAAATVNRRLATVRRVVVLARRFGLVEWSLAGLVDGLRVTTLRDTRGPGRKGWLALLKRAEWAARREKDAGIKGRRDLAIILLLHDNALRRSEVVGLELAHVELGEERIWVLGKGKAERVPITINEPTARAIQAWLVDRGEAPGPLFVRLDRAMPTGGCPVVPLDGDSIANMVRELGIAAMLPSRVRPHGLRHEGITRILDLTNGNIDAAQKFARHADPKTTQRYNDNRTDVAGEMSRLLARNR